MDKNEKILEEFLYNINCLDKLKEYTNPINIFEVLKVTNQEIRHSNILAWLLNPNETHHIGEGILKQFLEHICKIENSKLKIFDLLDIDYTTVIIKREFRNIDLLIEIKNKKLVLCIENKIWAKEHGTYNYASQLTKYKDIVDNEYIGYTPIYIYLSPDGDEASDTTNWISFDYGKIADIVEENLNNNHPKEVQLIMSNYIDIIRREIVKNSEIEKICLDIYREHKEALDLIYNNINIDDTYQIYEEIVSSLEKKQSECKDIIFDRQYSTKTHIRFRTKAMEKMFPKLENTVSYWNFPYDAFYEIINKRHNICIKFVVSASATYTQEDYTKLENKFKKIRKRKTSFGDKWKWKGTKKYTVKDMENKPIEEILDELKKKINHLIKEDDKIFK